LEVPHFSTAAPLSATRRTFQPPFTFWSKHRIDASGILSSALSFPSLKAVTASDDF
jgi:hypothetical protein